MDQLAKGLLSAALTLIVVGLLAIGPLRRAPTGVVLAVGAVSAVVIAAAVFFGVAGGGFALLCAGGVAAAGLAIYLLLWLMEKWASGGGD